MYVRRDGTKGPLQRPYSGPHAVLTPGDKTFLIDFGGRAERISVGRIKPAFFDPFQPVILAKTPDFRRTVFEVVHNLSHPGVKATVKMVSDKFVWHGMRKQVSRWVKECYYCQSSKIQNHTKAPLEHFSVSEKRFSLINIDIVGPLPFSSGFTYLLTIIDRNTRWPEAIPLRGITTPECVHALITGWIARFGVLGDSSSDRGSQFTSSLWSEIAAHLGVKLHHTPAYHLRQMG